MSLVTEIPAVECSGWNSNGVGACARERSARDGGHDVVEIGLLNNMPDEALRATERQFAELIGIAAEWRPVRLRRFFLTDIPRGEVARAYLRSQYADARTLWGTRLDALIVTGQEPRAHQLPDEPYWRSLTRLIDWAQDNTISAIWSCLAAHAAVLHLDGIKRRRLPIKLCGVFDCEPAGDDSLLHGIDGRFSVPHSRYNDLPPGELARRGYHILTRSSEAGADTFVRNGRSLFLFLQGHPEYDAHTLLGEYRRDMGRFLRGESETCPILPQSYFDAQSARILADFAESAQSDRRPELLTKFPEKSVIGPVSHRWRAPAITIFRNWLDFIISHKSARLRHAP